MSVAVGARTAPGFELLASLAGQSWELQTPVHQAGWYVSCRMPPDARPSTATTSLP